MLRVRPGEMERNSEESGIERAKCDHAFLGGCQHQVQRASPSPHLRAFQHPAGEVMRCATPTTATTSSHTTFNAPPQNNTS